MDARREPEETEDLEKSEPGRPVRRWVRLHRGPRAEVEFLAELIEAIHVPLRVESSVLPAESTSIRKPGLATEAELCFDLLVPDALLTAAEHWLERAFQDVWEKPVKRRLTEADEAESTSPAKARLAEGA